MRHKYLILDTFSIYKPRFVTWTRERLTCWIPNRSLNWLSSGSKCSRPRTIFYSIDNYIKPPDGVFLSKYSSKKIKPFLVICIALACEHISPVCKGTPNLVQTYYFLLASTTREQFMSLKQYSVNL
jgi:hypothetical protein